MVTNIFEILQNWKNNPENPKNVQIPFYIIVGIQMLLKKIDTDTLSDGDMAAYELVLWELSEKMRRVRNRQAYTEVVRAPDSEKQAALDDYHAMKECNF